MIAGRAKQQCHQGAIVWHVDLPSEAWRITAVYRKIVECRLGSSCIVHHSCLNAFARFI